MLPNMMPASLKAIAAVILVIFIIGQSCRKEESTSRFVTESKVIDAVKKEFFRQDLQLKLAKKFSDSITINWQPSWDEASERVTDSLSFAYIPLEQTNVNFFNQYNYLIAKKKDSVVSYYLGTYIPSADSSDNKAKMTFDSFSGGLLLEDLKTGARYFYDYKNGVPLNDSKLKGIAKQSSTSTTNSYYCTYRTVCNWGGGCAGGAWATYTYSPTSLYPNAFPCSPPSWIPCEDFGSWYQISSTVLQDCPTTGPPPPPPPPDPDLYGGYTGYGDTPSLYETNNQTPTPVDTNIRKIAYWCNNLTLTDRHTFVNNFYWVLNHAQRGCYNKYIMLNLEKTRKGKMAVCVNSNQPEPARYNPDLHSMSFKSTFYIAFNFMDHEFFHGYQNFFYDNGTSQYSTGNMTGYSNIEWETQLYKDITAPSEIPQAFHNVPDVNAEYVIWLQGLQVNHPNSFDEFGTITVNGITKSKYFYFLEKWKVQWPASTSQQTTYNTPIDYQLMPDALMNVFNNSSCP